MEAVLFNFLLISHLQLVMALQVRLLVHTCFDIPGREAAPINLYTYTCSGIFSFSANGLSIFTVAGIDYENVSTILAFPECANQRCVNISILDDMTVEMNQTFNISLDSTDERIIVDSDFVDREVDGEVVIVDNECEFLIRELVDSLCRDGADTDMPIFQMKRLRTPERYSYSYIIFHGVTHVVIVACNYPLSACIHELFVVALTLNSELYVVSLTLSCMHNLLTLFLYFLALPSLHPLTF